MSTQRAFLVVSIAFLLPLSISAEEMFRVWTDGTGQHRVEAKLVKTNATTVTLQRKDGNIVTLPIAKLSAADQALLKSMPTTSAAKLAPDPESKFVELAKQLRTNGRVSPQLAGKEATITGFVRKIEVSDFAPNPRVYIAATRVLPDKMQEEAESIVCVFKQGDQPWKSALPGQVIQVRGRVKNHVGWAALENVKVLSASGAPTEYVVREFGMKLQDNEFSKQLNEAAPGVDNFVLSGKVAKFEPYPNIPNVPGALVFTTGGKTIRIRLDSRISSLEDGYQGPRIGKPFRALVRYRDTSGDSVNLTWQAFLPPKR